jgi:hypothetical protein
MGSYAGPLSADLSIPSTTWEWKTVKMRRSSAPQGTENERSDFRPASGPRDPKRPLDVRIRFVGGPEASSEVRYRGRTWRFPGSVYLIDMLQFVNGQT